MGITVNTELEENLNNTSVTPSTDSSSIDENTVNIINEINDKFYESPLIYKIIVERLSNISKNDTEDINNYPIINSIIYNVNSNMNSIKKWFSKIIVNISIEQIYGYVYSNYVKQKISDEEQYKNILIDELTRLGIWDTNIGARFPVTNIDAPADLFIELINNSNINADDISIEDDTHIVISSKNEIFGETKTHIIMLNSNIIDNDDEEDDEEDEEEEDEEEEEEEEE